MKSTITTLDSLSIAVEIEQAKINGRTEQHCMSIGRRWAEPRSDWLPTQREMNELLQHSAAKLIVDDVKALHHQAWKGLKKSLNEDINLFYSHRSPGKSWMRKQWTQGRCTVGLVVDKPRKYQPGEFQLIAWDEATRHFEDPKREALLIDAPDSVNYHFLHRFHKVD